MTMNENAMLNAGKTSAKGVLLAALIWASNWASYKLDLYQQANPETAAEARVAEAKAKDLAEQYRQLREDTSLMLADTTRAQLAGFREQLASEVNTLRETLVATSVAGPSVEERVAAKLRDEEIDRLRKEVLVLKAAPASPPPSLADALLKDLLGKGIKQ